MSISEICKMLGYTKQAYYKRIKNDDKIFYEEELIVELVKEKRKLWKRGSGRNLHISLAGEFKKHNIKIGRDRFFEVLRSNGLLMTKKQRKTRTTYSNHPFRKYPNLIKEIEPTRPNQIIVSDITYIWLRNTENFAYLFLTTDMYSRKIMGYCLSKTLRAESALKTIKSAVRNMSDIEECIHHSDRGLQYCCNSHTNYLNKKEIKISMTENGDPLENPIAERINRTLKEEFTTQKQISFADFAEAEKEISKIIKFYNQERPHRSIEMLTPANAYMLTGKLQRKWKSYYKTDKKNSEYMYNLL